MITFQVAGAVCLAIALERVRAEAARAQAHGVAVEVRRLDHVVCGVAPALRRVISALLAARRQSGRSCDRPPAGGPGGRGS